MSTPHRVLQVRYDMRPFLYPFFKSLLFLIYHREKSCVILRFEIPGSESTRLMYCHSYTNNSRELNMHRYCDGRFFICQKGKGFKTGNLPEGDIIANVYLFLNYKSESGK